MRIGLDVDGTVYDWEANFRSMLKRFHRVDLPISTEWDSIDKACTRDQWNSIWEGYRLELFTGGLYYPGAQRFVQQVVANNHEVVFITATPGNVRTARAHALFDDFPGIYGVIFVEPMFDDKSLVQCDLYVDDKPKVVSTLLEQGHNAVLINRPWNQHVRDAVRVYTWDQLLNIVEGL